MTEHLCLTPRVSAFSHCNAMQQVQGELISLAADRLCPATHLTAAMGSSHFHQLPAQHALWQLQQLPLPAAQQPPLNPPAHR